MSVDREKLLLLANSVIPDLHDEFYKGQCGRIGFIGGCMQYTGAPYFASISSLKLGSDLVFVFCTASAAIPIKSYSPELIVIPILDSNDVETSLPRYLQGLHALVIGPGLGKDDSLTKAIMIAVKTMRDSNKPILLDADSLYFVGKDFDLIRDYSKAILTPNAIEFSRVYKILFGRDLSKEEMQSPRKQLEEVCKEIGSVTVVVKGRNDHISDGQSLLICDDEGSSRRCGGQGDLLVGSLANFAFWSNLAKNKSESYISKEGLNPFMIAAFAACTLTRKCNRLAFERFGRCMTTSDMIKELPNAFANLFPFKLKS